MIASWIVWLLAIYGFCSMLVQLLQKWNGLRNRTQDLSIHLLLYNSEASLEGVVRSFANLSRLSGQSLLLHVYDFGSNDLTIPILAKLSQEFAHLIREVHYDVGWDELNSRVFDEKAGNTIDLRQKV